MIKKFINEIRKNPEYCEYKYTFLGDGVGDFEEIKDHTTKECLDNYIKYCKDQIVMATDVIRGR